jgi:hypothetical protein
MENTVLSCCYRGVLALSCLANNLGADHIENTSSAVLLTTCVLRACLPSHCVAVRCNIYGLFYDLSVVTQTVWFSVVGWLERIWKEMVFCLSKILSWHLPWGTEKSTINLSMFSALCDIWSEHLPNMQLEYYSYMNLVQRGINRNLLYFYSFDRIKAEILYTIVNACCYHFTTWWSFLFMQHYATFLHYQTCMVHSFHMNFKYVKLLITTKM